MTNGTLVVRKSRADGTSENTFAPRPPKHRPALPDRNP